MLSKPNLTNIASKKDQWIDTNFFNDAIPSQKRFMQNNFTKVSKIKKVKAYLQFFLIIIKTNALFSNQVLSFLI